MAENYDSSDKKAVKKAKQKERNAEQTRLNDFEFVMSSAQGRRFVNRILEISGVFQSTFVRGDAHATSFKEGQRNVGLVLMADINSDPDIFKRYNQMMKEEREKRKNE